MDEDPKSGWLLEWWLDQAWWIRVGCGALVALAGAVVVYLGVSHSLAFTRYSRNRAIVAGVMLIGFGLVLMFLGGKSDRERNGYHF